MTIVPLDCGHGIWLPTLMITDDGRAYCPVCDKYAAIIERDEERDEERDDRDHLTRGVE